MTQGNRLMVFVIVLLAGLVAMAGALACGVGMLFTAPLACCVMAAMYRQLKGVPAGASGLVDIPPPPPPPPAV